MAEGIPKGSQTLVVGGPGTGKTLLGFEYLYRAAVGGEIGLFFSFEEESGLIIENARGAFADFKDLEKLIAEKKIVILGSNETRQYIQKDTEGTGYTFGKMVTEIESLVEATRASRVFIDSVSMIKMFIKEPFEYRNLSMSMASILRRLHVTGLFSMEIAVGEKAKLKFLPEFFIYDGIIAMYTKGDENSRVLSIEVIKMRGADHSFSTCPYRITSSGINIQSAAEKGSKR